MQRRMSMRRGGWLVAGVLAIGCSRDAAAPTPVVTGKPAPAQAGLVDPAPESALALGRAVFEAMQRDDWEGYTTLLATRGDMMGLYSTTDRSEGRQRRRRRRMVWRRINRLRGGEAEEGWKTARREAELEGVAWDAVRLVDVRSESVSPHRLPPGTETAELYLVLEHAGVEQVLALGACARSKRGWVALYPMRWQGTPEGGPRGESLQAG